MVKYLVDYGDSASHVAEPVTFTSLYDAMKFARRFVRESYIDRAWANIREIVNPETMPNDICGYRNNSGQARFINFRE